MKENTLVQRPDIFGMWVPHLIEPQNVPIFNVQMSFPTIPHMNVKLALQYAKYVMNMQTLVRVHKKRYFIRLSSLVALNLP